MVGVPVFRVPAGLVLAAMAVLTSCGPDAQTDYSEQTGSNFFAACTVPLEDSILRSRLCQCVFDAVTEEISYAEFEEFDAVLVEDPTTPIPQELTDIVARCVIEEADL